MSNTVTTPSALTLLFRDLLKRRWLVVVAWSALCVGVVIDSAINPDSDSVYGVAFAGMVGYGIWMTLHLDAGRVMRSLPIAAADQRLFRWLISFTVPVAISGFVCAATLIVHIAFARRDALATFLSASAASIGVAGVYFATVSPPQKRLLRALLILAWLLFPWWVLFSMPAINSIVVWLLCLIGTVFAIRAFAYPWINHSDDDDSWSSASNQKFLRSSPVRHQNNSPPSWLWRGIVGFVWNRTRSILFLGTATCVAILVAVTVSRSIGRETPDLGNLIPLIFVFMPIIWLLNIDWQSDIRLLRLLPISRNLLTLLILIITILPAFTIWIVHYAALSVITTASYVPFEYVAPLLTVQLLTAPFLMHKATSPLTEGLGLLQTIGIIVLQIASPLSIVLPAARDQTPFYSIAILTLIASIAFIWTHHELTVGCLAGNKRAAA